MKKECFEYVVSWALRLPGQPLVGGRELGTGNMVLAPYEEMVGMDLKKFFLTNAFN